MACNSCVEKLAKRLVRNHKINWAEALKRAHEGIKRYELRISTPPPGIEYVKGFHPLSEQTKSEIHKQFGFNPDYSWTCSSSGDCSCKALTPCIIHIMCLNLGDCSCSCGTSPKANSHVVSDTCIVFYAHNCECGLENCLGDKSCNCTCNGLCYYDCDDGFEWDSTSETCVEIPEEPNGNGEPEPEPEPTPEEPEEPNGNGDDDECVPASQMEETLGAEDVDETSCLHLIPPQV